jgi:hypothetical protein
MEFSLYGEYALKKKQESDDVHPAALKRAAKQLIPGLRTDLIRTDVHLAAF